MKKVISVLLLTVMAAGLMACSGAGQAQADPLYMAAAMVDPMPRRIVTDLAAQLIAQAKTAQSPLPPVEVYGTAKGSVAEVFSEGLAWFKDASGKYGYINTKGDVVIPAQYSYATNFHKGLAVVSFSKSGAVHDIVIDTEGNTVFRNLDSGSLYVDVNDYFDRDVFPAVKIYKATVKGGKVTKIDPEGLNFMLSDGKLLTKDKFMSIGGFFDGIAKVGTGKKPKKTMTTMNGATFDPPYMRFGSFSGNTFVEAATAYYHIRTDGKRVEKENYDGAGDFGEGLAAVAKYDVKGRLKWGYIDATGTLVLPMEWDTAGRFQDGRAIVSKNGKYGVIDSAGQIIVELSFESLSRPNEEGISTIKSGEKWGYADQNGNILIPAEWDSVGSFSNGKAVVGKKIGEDWVYTLIDTAGTPMLSGSYAALTRLKDGYYSFAEVKGGQRGLMRESGEVVFGPTWDGIMTMGDETALLRVKQGDKYGLIDWDGTMVREPEFDSIGAAADGVSIVKKSGFWFIMDPKTGEILF